LPAEVITRGALAEMRALIFELQPGALAEEGLVAALAKQASALSAREGLVIEVDGPDERLPIGVEVEEQLYRIGQEALPTWSDTPGQPAPRTASPQPTTASRSR
jgi:signal transduction histidine kinase